MLIINGNKFGIRKQEMVEKHICAKFENEFASEKEIESVVNGN